MIEFVFRKKLSLAKYGVLFLLVIFCQACSLKVPVDSPEQSLMSFTAADKNTKGKVFQFEDQLGEKHKLSQGILPINLVHDNMPITASFISTNLSKELQARGLPIKFSDDAADKLSLKKFEILSHRVSGFSPMVTISMLKIGMQNGGDEINLVSVVKRGKVPVWSMDEINEPCYNQPVELLIKELAAKINQATYGYSLGNDVVERLVKKIKAESGTNDLAYLDVYELGFSNNPAAIAPLKMFTHSEDEYIRLAAISNLGILKAEGSFDDLVSIYKNSKLWQDRGMALKAIGDIGSRSAMEFLKKERKKWADNETAEGKWNLMIIDLYLG